MPSSKSETGCCKRFDPRPWQDKKIVWKNKLFVKARTLSFLHIPINFGQVVVKNVERIEAAKANPEVPLMLADENSLWGADLYIAVSKKVPGAEMATISGTFLSRVFEGPFQDMGKWIPQMNDYVQKKSGRPPQKLLFFYTTCPKCAEAYGKNYVVVLAQV